MKHEWKDVLDNNGVLLTSGTERLLVSLKNESSKVLHVLDIPTARALHEALGCALEEIDTRPITDSISATIAACANPVQEIVRVHPSGAGDHGSTDVTTGDGMTRYAVQQVLGKSLRDISVDELAKMGLKPSQPEPHPTGNGASALHPRPFFWDSNDLFCFVNCEMTPSVSMDFLLQCVPNALDGRESHHPLGTGDHPRFGFRLEHDGARTLREYLESP